MLIEAAQKRVLPCDHLLRGHAGISAGRAAVHLSNGNNDKG